MTVSVIMYKRLGISNANIALYTSWLYLPWVIKPLWSPVIDILKTKRYWIVIMQLIVGAGLAGVAFTIPAPNFFRYTLAFFWLLAFSSATHDIAADGFYMLGLTKHEQAFFVGIRSTFYRFAMLTGQGLLVILAGHFETSTGLPPVDIKVYSKPDISAVHIFSPDSVIIDIQQGEQRIVPKSQTLNIATSVIEKKYADSLILLINQWNINHGFYSDDKTKETDIERKTSWWKKYISKYNSNDIFFFESNKNTR